MKLDFYHNKIVADVISEEFEACFMRELVPVLTAKYGEIDTVQMYEDYISDNLMADGYWYYPLTLIIGEEIKTQWIRWQINKTDFDDGLPYAFSGSGNIGFELCDAPGGFEERIAGRARCYAGGSVGVRIEIVKGDSYRLSGRYSQTFIDEMARQLTPAIESATGVTGIADSSVELVMVFASGTYMEHISENVTYRRLMLVDKVSAPRDFWIKWTRLDGAVAHPISAHVSAENILFELGEDVHQKIREREYRYLLSSGKEKYHNSMGRKKVTEWREVIKRAARRGELAKVESDFELAPETLELEERIADLLGRKIAARNEPEKAEIPYITEEQPENDEFSRAMEKARMVVEGNTADEPEELTLSDITSEIPEDEPGDADAELDEEPLTLTDDESEGDESVVEFEGEEDESESEPDEFDFDEEADEPEEENEAEVEESNESEETEDELDIFADVEPEEVESDIFEDAESEAEEADEESAEKFEIEEAPEEELVIEDEPDEEICDDPVNDSESESEIEEIADEPDEEFVIEDESNEEFIIEDEPVEAVVEEIEETVEEIAEDVPAPEEDVEDVADAPAPVYAAEPGIAERVADIRAELETKIRLEYEIRAREKAERELVELRHKLQRLQTESELTIAELKSENERLTREYDRMLEQIESERFAREAEEARRRLEEKQLREEIERQLRAEAAERERLAESARMAIEEQRRLEAENARIAREREEEARAEAERIRREEHERELEAIRQAELERIHREQEEAKARAKSAMPEMGDGKYSYTTKTVKLVFRRSVDPNITTRIQQLIKTTVDYYGKDNVYLRIRATVPDTQTVLLEFVDIPLEEMPLLGNIIKVLGNGGLGIAKAIIE